MRETNKKCKVSNILQYFPKFQEDKTSTESNTSISTSTLSETSVESEVLGYAEESTNITDSLLRDSVFDDNSSKSKKSDAEQPSFGTGRTDVPPNDVSPAK